jgi:hypothetical protein
MIINFFWRLSNCHCIYSIELGGVIYYPFNVDLAITVGIPVNANIVLSHFDFTIKQLLPTDRGSAQ